MAPSGTEKWTEFEEKARALCAGGCELGPTVFSQSTGPDGQALAEIKSCTSNCATCIKKILTEQKETSELQKFAEARRAVGEPSVLTSFYHDVSEDSNTMNVSSDQATAPASMAAAA